MHIGYTEAQPRGAALYTGQRALHRNMNCPHTESDLAPANNSGMVPL